MDNNLGPSTSAMAQDGRDNYSYVNRTYYFIELGVGLRYG